MPVGIIAVRFTVAIAIGAAAAVILAYSAYRSQRRERDGQGFRAPVSTLRIHSAVSTPNTQSPEISTSDTCGVNGGGTSDLRTRVLLKVLRTVTLYPWVKIGFFS